MAALNNSQGYTVTRPWIAVMDLSVTKNSPAGSCVLAEVIGLADEYDITVFSDDFDNERPDRVRWVRVPLPRRPGILRYVVFHLMARFALKRHARERGQPPLLIQATQGQYVGADICYAHFCHRAYLRDRWQSQTASGWLRLLRWLGYRYNAHFEELAFRRTRLVVTPSRGLGSEIEQTYPFLQGRVHAIPNPIDVSAFARPADFDRQAQRRALALNEVHHMLCFAALGDFSRKGLALILQAMSQESLKATSLIVVGGRPGEIADFQRQAATLGLAGRVAFTGFQKDVRPYFWAADLFVFPSIYETFALVVMQAMAAGMPVVTTRLHGVEEYAIDGQNALIVERDATAIAQAIDQILRDPVRLERAAEVARRSTQAYDTPAFVAHWRQLMKEQLS